MNLSKLGPSVWILILLFLLLSVLLVQLRQQSSVIDTFVIAPLPSTDDDPKVVAANTNYATLLQFIKENPSKSAKFIMDIRQKFFNNECQVKEYINFNDITTFSDGAPFT